MVTVIPKVVWTREFWLLVTYILYKFNNSLPTWCPCLGSLGQALPGEAVGGEVANGEPYCLT